MKLKTYNKKIKKVIILGAGGRDFHNFNVYFRNNPDYKVMAFTATQIPGIENRIYPPELAGALYPKGIPIFPEKELSDLIKKYKIDEAIFAYSDVSHQEVMHKASQVLAGGADFVLMGPKTTMLKSEKPVIAVCAVRTGCGKGSVTRKIAKILKKRNRKIAIIRHPMPYGDLKKQIVQRFENYKDLDKAKCTIEEREEHEPIIRAGFVVWAGVDYEKILRQAEKEADVIIWDGGNNDLPFIKPDLFFTLTDPHRVGHETSYYQGETNLRMADVVIIGKEGTAEKKDIKQLCRNIKKINPKAKIIHGKSKILADKPKLIKNKNVLVIEDGPTATHGEMPFGAGMVAALKYGAKEIVEPKKWAKGTLRETFKNFPHLQRTLPAMGYSERQIKDLQLTINAIPCDLVISATPINLSKIIKINKPMVQISYEFEEIGILTLTKILEDAKLI